MKKFLTVLLALSVVFTYTVGTAFAALPTDPNAGDDILTEAQVSQKINDAYDLALKELAAKKDGALVDIFGAGKTIADINGITVTKAAVEKVYADLYNAAVEKVEANKTAALDAVSAAIKDVNDNAAKKDQAKAYNGYFQTQSVAADDDAWMMDGYAKYNASWENMNTYLSGATYIKGAYLALFDKTGAGTKADNVAREVFKAAKADALGAVQVIDLDNYSKEYNGAAQSNYDKALADKTAAIKALNELSIAETAEWAVAKSGIDAVADIYVAPVNQGSAKGTLYTGGTTEKLVDAGLAKEVTFNGLDKISTIADEPTEAAKLEWAKSKVLAGFTKDINDALTQKIEAANKIILDETLAGAKGDAQKIADAKEAIADAKEEAAAALDVATYLVNATDDLDKLINEKKPFSTSDVLYGEGAGYQWWYNDGKVYANYYNGGVAYDTTKLLAVVKHIADLKDQAEILKNTEAIDGATIVEIDKALEKAIDETYKGNVNATLYVHTALSIVYDRQMALIGKNATDIKVNDKKYPTVEAWDDNLARDYNTQYYAEVRKVIAETKEAIKAATTVADADAAFVAGYEKLDAVPTINDKELAQATKEFKDLRDDYAKDITQYAAYKAGLIDGTDYSWTQTTMVEKLIKTLDDAYTVDELKAAYADAKAEIDNLKTKAEMKTAAAELQKKVNELASTATKDEVAALREAVDAHNDYCILIGDNVHKVTLTSKLDDAENVIKNAEAKAIKDQYDAIMKDGKVTTDEADAVAALRAAYDAFVAYYSDPEAVNFVEPSPITSDKVIEVEENLDKALVKAFYIMVAQLPADGSDVAGIKAAKDAYDALSDYAKYGLGAYQSAAYDKLADLQKILIKNVESLKVVKNHSVAGKGYIKLTWSTKGNAAGVDGYQVYRSTKKNSGFGTKPIFTTANKTYKNTKSLKKGTRYYYKVRAFVEIDGQKYYSDWSNKAYRVAK